MRVLVTGGSGFIGGYLVAELRANGHDVRILDEKPSTRHPDLAFLGDVREKGDVLRAADSVDVIYHLAAEHHDDVRPRSLYYDVNVEGTRNVARAARVHGVSRIVFTSTSAVYSLEVSKPDERSRKKPFNDYGKSKLKAEGVLRGWAKEDGTRTLAILRPCAVFGHGHHGNVRNLIRAISQNYFVMVGSGENRKSLAYVENLSRFLTELLTWEYRILTVNYADKPDYTTSELVSIVQNCLNGNRNKGRIPYLAALVLGYVCDAASAVTGRSLPVSSIRVRKFCAETRLDTSLLEEMGFSRPHSLKHGLQQTVKRQRLAESGEKARDHS